MRNIGQFKTIDCLPGIKTDFELLIQKSWWFDQTKYQINKDFELSGLRIEGLMLFNSVDQLLNELTLTLNEIRAKNSSLDQLLYRIDLPSQLDSNSLSNEELAEVVILRSFQKVWLRRTYSK